MSTTDALRAAIQAHEAGRLAEAEAIYRQILAVEPENVAAWHLLGRLAEQAGQLDAAIECIGKAVSLKPDYAEAYVDLGLVRQKQGKLDEAIEHYRQALCSKPGLILALNNLGNALKEKGDFEGAVAAYLQAIAADPQFAEPHSNLGLVYREQGNFTEAIVSLKRAIELSPRYAEAHNNLAVVYRESGQHGQAATHFRLAISFNPTDAEAHYNQATHWLLLGDFQRGWPKYEWRWQRRGVRPLELPELLWDGRELGGRRLLLHAEQGLGDTIQFARYAPLAKERGAHVILACQKPLMPVLSRCAGVDELVGKEADSPPFDVHLPLMSMPRVFGTTLETIPSRPYVFADGDLEGEWGRRLAEVKGLQVGIVWSGNPAYSEDRRRSFRLSECRALAKVPNLRLISLQKGAGSEQVQESADHLDILDFGQELDRASGAFMDTAAIIRNLDLVIAPDTSLAHLAGALGARTWLVLPYTPDWRWMLERSDSPWYPTMRIFRQKRPGDWAGVFEDVANALRSESGG